MVGCLSRLWNKAGKAPVLSLLHSKLGPTTIASASNDFSQYQIVSEVAQVFSHSTNKGRANLNRAKDDACKALGETMELREKKPEYEDYWVEKLRERTQDFLRARHNLEQTPTLEERTDYVREYADELAYVSKIRWSGLVNMNSRIVAALLERKFPHLKEVPPSGLRRSIKVWGYFAAFPDEVDLMPGCLGFAMTQARFMHRANRISCNRK